MLSFKMKKNHLILFFIIIQLFSIRTYADSYSVKNIDHAISPDGNIIAHFLSGDCKKNVLSSIDIYTKSDPSTYKKFLTSKLNNCYLPDYVYINNDRNVIAIYTRTPKKNNVIIEILDEQGKNLTTYRLGDIYNEELLSKMLVTASTIHWKCIGLSPRFIKNSSIEMHDSVGGLIVLNTLTGKYEYKKNPYATCKKIFE